MRPATVHGKCAVCELCWRLLRGKATSGLGDAVKRIVPNGSSLAISRGIASAIRDPDDRLYLWLHLTSTLKPGGHDRHARVLLSALVDELRNLDVPDLQALDGTASSVRAYGDCEVCGRHRLIAGTVGGLSHCDRCLRTNPDTFRACDRCGTLEYPSRTGLCRHCRAHNILDETFTAELLKDKPELAAVYHRLRQTEGTYLFNAIKSRTSWLLLTTLIRHPEGISHAVLDSLGSPTATRYLRSFLVRSGVLPERDENLHRFEDWVTQQSTRIEVNDDRLMFLRFARFRHLRRARHQARTAAEVANDRRELRLVVTLLTWLQAGGRTLRSATHADFNEWLATTPDGEWVKPFTDWCCVSGITHGFEVPARVRSANSLNGLDTSEHLDLIRRTFDPAAPIPSRDRLAAGLVLLFGVRVHQIARLSLNDITTESRRTRILIGTDPLELPEPLGEYARAAGAGSTITAFGGTTTDTAWLYPGRVHGSPLTPASVAVRLRAIGISPNAARRTALTQLALQLPPVVLSRLIGININTACSWAIIVGSATSNYAAVLNERSGLSAHFEAVR
jgi:integrase